MLDGVLAVDKGGGILSSKVVDKVKRVLKEGGIVSKVGHGGTLDKFASGLLLILLGKATKLFEEIKDLPKVYVGVIKLGEVRTTDDVYGEVVQSFDSVSVSRNDIEVALKNFEGEILQLPPAFSSVHIEGRRAYQIAKRDYYSALRSLKPKKVNVYKIELLEFDPDNAEVRVFVKCSGGTYIRSIARDLGQILGTGAFLKELRREAIGNVSVDGAVGSSEISVDVILRKLVSIDEFRKANSL
ncbi:MAG: tRNA pseudouridine(55) synthase TruB [Brevinematia bacterium]